MRMNDIGSLQDERDAAVRVWATLADGRTSTRRFTERPVPDGWIAQMLQEARRASSGANRQPGEFIRIDGAARQKLSDPLVEKRRSSKRGLQLIPRSHAYDAARPSWRFCRKLSSLAPCWSTGSSGQPPHQSWSADLS